MSFENNLYEHWNLPGQGEILDLETAASRIKDWRSNLSLIPPAIVVTSCPGDPIHTGHVTALQDSLPRANEHLKMEPYRSTRRGAFLFVLVNDDLFLERKKGQAFMPHKVRCQIISGLRGVDFVIPFETKGDDQTVSRALKALSPDFFTKGGDRSDPKSIPEWQLCWDMGCGVITGCGQDKLWSSSDFLTRWSNAAYWKGFKDGRGE